MVRAEGADTPPLRSGWPQNVCLFLRLPLLTRGSLYDSSDQKCDWCDWCDLWLAFNFGPWFFFVIGVIDVICVIDVIDMIDVINVIDVIDVIGVINVISVIDVIGVIDVILLSQNMIWRTQFYCFFYIFCRHCFFLFCHLRKFWSFKTLKKFW